MIEYIGIVSEAPNDVIILKKHFIASDARDAYRMLRRYMDDSFGNTWEMHYDIAILAHNCSTYIV